MFHVEHSTFLIIGFDNFRGISYPPLVLLNFGIAVLLNTKTKEMPMQARKAIYAFLFLLIGVSILSGCEKKRTPGQALDDALKKTGEAVESAGKEIQETAETQTQ